MKKSILSLIAAASFFSVLNFPSAYAGSDPSKGYAVNFSRADAKDNICDSVKTAIAEKRSAKGVVKSKITMGHNSCLVIKCAVHAGGNLEEIISGATEAGVTSDVISRCCISAGSDPREVAKNLVRVGLPGYCGLGYSEPPGPDPTPPPHPTPPPPPVSPYRFR